MSDKLQSRSPGKEKGTSAGAIFADADVHPPAGPKREPLRLCSCPQPPHLPRRHLCHFVSPGTDVLRGIEAMAEQLRNHTIIADLLFLTAPVLGRGLERLAPVCGFLTVNRGCHTTELQGQWGLLQRPSEALTLAQRRHLVIAVIELLLIRKGSGLLLHRKG